MTALHVAAPAPVPEKTREVDRSGVPVFELKSISHRYGRNKVIFDVSMSVWAGEVVALVGDNGAGKSTLIKAIAGIQPGDEYNANWDGDSVTLNTPQDATRLGIATVYQDLALCDNLDIVQNLFLGRERTRFDLLNEESMEIAARETLQSLSVTTVRSIRQPVASLSGGQRQAVAIAKSVLWNSRLVIMDEPTAALGVAQTRMVLDLVRRLADRGVGVIIISHNMNDVFEVADRIAILHLGRMVVSGPISEFDRETVVDYMTSGRSSRTPRNDADAAADRGSPES